MVKSLEEGPQDYPVQVVPQEEVEVPHEVEWEALDEEVCCLLLLEQGQNR